MKIAVLGSGAWGTALASRLAGNAAHSVTLWGRSATLIDAINTTHRNEAYLPGIDLSNELRATLRFDDAIAGSELIILGGPVAATETLLKQIPADHRATVLSLSKGFVANGTDAARTELLPQAMRRHRSKQAGLLSGPSFAGETARGLPLALVCAMPSLDDAQQLANALRDPAMRIYASDDLIGVAVCGAVKNVFAIAAGISDGFALGANARAALVTRGLAEMRRLVAACGGNVDTVSGLAGVGDVLLTTTGDASRNRRVGLELAAGKSLAEILAALGHVAEGVNAARLTRNLAAEHNVEMPISSAVAALIEGSLTPKAAIEALLTRKSRAEF
ncbi:MAG: NAD(P)-dependent glycerol-3-phosphate dehydrogenase [Betaproteobacteria bacterium]|nr:MAG: NAD(P)-dependent glycerol-3-phosphate dehydrogenase [Betaproteobacteria bacterium]